MRWVHGPTWGWNMKLLLVCGAVITALGVCLFAPMTEQEATMRAAQCLRFDSEVTAALGERLGIAVDRDGRPIQLGYPVSAAASVAPHRFWCGPIEHVAGASVPLATTKVAMVTLLPAEATATVAGLTRASNEPVMVMGTPHFIALMEEQGWQRRFLVARGAPELVRIQ